jgi:hypothetical protein
LALSGVLLACSFGGGPATNAGDSAPLVGIGDAGASDAADAPASGGRCRTGEQRACYDGAPATRAVGSCRAGIQGCEQGRWGECRDAQLPQADLCDGSDNDCDERVDEGDPAANRTCDSGMQGLCANGVALCQGGELRCMQAFEPRAEQCNGMDDDCDGQSDEDFLAAGAEVYAHADHCGACGQACGGSLEGSASERCAQLDGGAVRCEVEHCKRGYIQLDALTCERALPDPCRRCANDGQCAHAGDACLELPGERVCGIDCGEGNLYGTPAGECPEGYGCTALGDGQRQCVPASGSCSCLDDHDGMTRQCVVSSAAGACAGSQRCNANSGWAACDAQTPATETCNGQDDDCDNEIDEGDPGGGGGCVTGLQGICAAGRLTCTPEGLICQPRMAPLPNEICGNQQDDDCDGQRDEACCPHSECELGDPLPALCSSCTTSVCFSDTYCCDQADGDWDDVCIELAHELCPALCTDG